MEALWLRMRSVFRTERIVMQWLTAMRKRLSGPRERRRLPRRAGGALVAHYWTGGPPAPRPLLNVDLDGAFVQTPDRLWQTGTVVTLTLQANGIDRAPVPYLLHAVVVRAEPD